jgi:hypothetical protein
VKFGRKRPVARGPHFKLRNYLRAALPTPPSSCDYSAAAEQSLRSIYGNDTLGDCVVAGAYHVVGVETGNASGVPFVATFDQILSDYSAIGGYKPGDETTDNGCDEVTAQNYWVQHGFANGTKLAGWLALDASNRAEVQAACWLFENLYFGIELPDSWISPFPSADSFVWDVGAPNPQNGHCVMGFGYTEAGVLIDTWALKGTLTWAAIAALCSDAAGGSVSVWLTPDQLARGQEKAPNGVAWADLVSDFDSMGGSAPLPGPTPPAPAPGVPATLESATAWATAPLSAGPPLLTREQAVVLATRGLAANWPSP